MATIAVWDKVRDMVDDKRDELYAKYGRRFTQMDVASVAITNGINSVEEDLGLRVNNK